MLFGGLVVVVVVTVMMMMFLQPAALGFVLFAL